MVAHAALAMAAFEIPLGVEEELHSSLKTLL